MSTGAMEGCTLEESNTMAGVIQRARDEGMQQGLV